MCSVHFYCLRFFNASNAQNNKADILRAVPKIHIVFKHCEHNARQGSLWRLCIFPLLFYSEAVFNFKNYLIWTALSSCLYLSPSEMLYFITCWAQIVFYVLQSLCTCHTTAHFLPYHFLIKHWWCTYFWSSCPCFLGQILWEVCSAHFFFSHYLTLLL